MKIIVVVVIISLFSNNVQSKITKYKLYNDIYTQMMSDEASLAVARESHYGDVLMGVIASQITSLTTVYSTFIQAQIKGYIKAPRHWPLWEEFTGDR